MMSPPVRLLKTVLLLQTLEYATSSFKRTIKQERTTSSNRRLFPIRRHRTIDKLTNCRAFCNNNNNLKYLVLMNNDQILCTQIYVFVLNHKRMFHAYLIPFDAKARRNLEIMQLYNLVKHDLTLKKNCFTLQSSLSYHFKVSLIRDLAAATCC